MGAFNVGFAQGLNSGARGGDKHADLSDEERETALDGYNGTIKSLQDKMSADPGNAAAYQSQLQQVVADRTDLFHPRHGPGAMAHLGRLFHAAAHGSDPAAAPAAPATTVAPNPTQMPDTRLPDGTVIPAQPNSERPTIHVQTPADAKARMAQDLSFGAGLPQQNEIQEYRTKMIGGGFSPEDAEKATRIHFGLDPKPVATKPEVESWKRDGQPYKGKDGKWYERQANKAGEVREQAMPENFQPAANVPKSQFAQLRADYAKAKGVSPDDLSYDDELNMMRLNKQSQTATTHNTRTVFQMQPNGDIVALQAPSSTSKDFGGKPVTRSKGEAAGTGGGEAAAPPKVDSSAGAGAARKRAKAVQSGDSTPEAAPTSATPEATPRNGRIVPGSVVGHRNTPAQAAAEKDVGAATKLVDLADDAWHNPSSAKDKQLVLSLIRTTAGRVNLSEYSIYTQRAGLGNSLEAFANSISTGQLPLDVRRQLVQLSHANLKASTQARDSEYDGSAYAKKPAKTAAKKVPAKTAANAISDDDFLMGVGGKK